jgi:hypothetical protein
LLLEAGADMHIKITLVSGRNHSAVL